MDREDIKQFHEFQITLSRELGEITTELKTIVKELKDTKTNNTAEFKAVWDKIGGNSGDIVDMKIRAAYISGGISILLGVFLNLPNILRSLNHFLGK